MCLGSSGGVMTIGGDYSNGFDWAPLTHVEYFNSNLFLFNL